MVNVSREQSRTLVIRGAMTGTPAQHRQFLNLGFDPGGCPPLAELRQAVRNALSGERSECVADVELLVTELVANAYEHGRPPCTVRAWQLPNRSVRVEVEDGSRHDLPVMGISRLGEVRGRGLIMVNALANRWGVTLGQVGKTVWAEVNCRLLTLVPDLPA